MEDKLDFTGINKISQNIIDSIKLIVSNNTKNENEIGIKTFYENDIYAIEIRICIYHKRQISYNILNDVGFNGIVLFTLLNELIDEESMKNNLIIKYKSHKTDLSILYSCNCSIYSFDLIYKSI